MLLSLVLIIFLSLALSKICMLLKLPGLLGMLVTGIVLGPFVLDLIDPSILTIAPDLRQIALIVILVRAGLSLDLKDLKEVGKTAFLLSFIPASIEMIAITLLAPLFFGISYLEAAIMGAVVAAVSPAVVVPRMIKLMKTNYGKEKRIPQLILASASIDDVFVIIIFMSLIRAYQVGTFQFVSILFIPLSIVLGILLGILCGICLTKLFKAFHMRDTVKVLIIFGISFSLVTLEYVLDHVIPISGLIAVVTLGISILYTYPILAKRLVGKFEKIWVIAEIMLFVLVGAALQISILKDVGLFAVLLILSALVFRIIGVYVALIGTKLNMAEKLFVAISYTPKATVQAAIGSMPLALGIPSGHIILSVAVLAIVLTAPIGAILIDKTHEILLIETK